MKQKKDKRPTVVWPSIPATIDYSKSKTDREIFIETARNMLLKESSPFKLPLFVLPFAGTGFGPRCQGLAVLGSGLGTVEDRQVPELQRWRITEVANRTATAPLDRRANHTSTTPPKYVQRSAARKLATPWACSEW